MAYTIVNPNVAGILPIASTDAGATTVGGTTIPSPPLTLGMIVRASDPTYGEGEFILLVGVASTLVGSVVTYNTTSYTTALAPAGTNLPQPIAVSMAANTSASVYSWYQISGMAVAVKNSTTATFAVGGAVGIATAGILHNTASGIEVQGALAAATALVSNATAVIVINRPHMQGRIT